MDAHFHAWVATDRNERARDGYETLDETGPLQSYNMYSAIFVFIFSTRCDAVANSTVESTVHNTTSSSYIPHEYIYANK